ncbi:DNA N-6-adenine-methyltransferase [Paracoccus hibiscisoli]|uniref:DNA N-6-adenine-methyltransferase n=2 Tax=Paracoccus TaxID=265 RepID=UPI0023EFC9D6|nr:DNA N-6-adenine-methyltransferase [Paracoccus hibiscisoli]
MKNDEWLTPPALVEALGPFDLDPCSPSNRRPWDTASVHYGRPSIGPVADGLALPWFGRVWLNPPYGREAANWLDRLADHGNGMALIFARTETDMFFEHVWKKADALAFLRGRLHFHYVDGKRAAANSGAPSVIAAYGVGNVERLQDIPGDKQIVVLDRGIFG